MTYHAMFSLYITTGLLALVISVSLFCESVAEAKLPRVEITVPGLQAPGAYREDGWNLLFRR